MPKMMPDSVCHLSAGLGQIQGQQRAVLREPPGTGAIAAWCENGYLIIRGGSIRYEISAVKQLFAEHEQLLTDAAAGEKSQ